MKEHKQFGQHGRPKGQPGRKQKLTARQKRLLKRSAYGLLPQQNLMIFFFSCSKLLNGVDTSLAKVTHELGLDIGNTTARRVLREMGYKGRKPRKIPLVSAVNRKRRVQWAKTWKATNWDDILFTDEKKWMMVRHKRNWVWRLVTAKWHPSEADQRTQAGGGSIMVWGAISHRRTYPLIEIPTTLDAVGYRDQVLRKFLGNPPASRSTRGHRGLPWTFMHDNASIHTARVVEDFLKDHAAVVLPWPANSPDLNPIENLWAIVSQKVYKTHRFSSKPDLLAALQQEWAAVDPALLQKLYDSIPRRCEEVIKYKGWPTRY